MMIMMSVVRASYVIAAAVRVLVARRVIRTRFRLAVVLASHCQSGCVVVVRLWLSALDLDQTHRERNHNQRNQNDHKQKRRINLRKPIHQVYVSDAHGAKRAAIQAEAVRVVRVETPARIRSRRLAGWLRVRAPAVLVR